MKHEKDLSTLNSIGYVEHKLHFEGFSQPAESTSRCTCTHTSKTCTHIRHHIQSRLSFHSSFVWCSLTEMSPAEGDKLLSRKNIKLKGKTNENISPPATPAHQSSLGYMLQRQQDLENVLFNNVAEVLFIPAGNTRNLSCLQKQNCLMVSLRKEHSTLEGQQRNFAKKCSQIETVEKVNWSVRYFCEEVTKYQ